MKGKKCLRWNGFSVGAFLSVTQNNMFYNKLFLIEMCIIVIGDAYEV